MALKKISTKMLTVLFAGIPRLISSVRKQPEVMKWH